MKIAILGATNIKHMSLLTHYLDIIDNKKNVVDIIYTDKYGVNEPINNVNQIYKFDVNINNNMSFFRKALEYYKFRPFVKKILKQNNYDFIIVWGSYTAHLFKDVLIRHYKDKYIVNIRDYFFENNKFIYLRMKKIIENSFITTLSSPGFKHFLPKATDKLKVIYSINKDVINNSIKNETFNFNKPIKIGFIGNVRFLDMNKMLMDCLKNDSRFILQFFGTGSNNLKEYAERKSINNVEFISAFNVNETSQLLNNIDILNNVYGNNSMSLNYALSIRLYYSLFLRKPILTSPNTLTSQEAHTFNLAFDIDENNNVNLGDLIENWINNIDYHEVDIECRKYIEKITSINDEFYQYINGRFNYEDI
ncbi:MULTISPECIES: hypothetical protein [Staphylococcus]|uniref:Capsular biosynthesis protein n=1 Tax=Staphylococcus agnetis TaxID=985762 RepID=A0A2T4MIC4_9STAP|nr:MULTISPECIES: hypothetical protein [Staphylococcus]ALN77290.1 capsular biosynthesis protein [Staphylococcus agnetis]NHM91688.1 glycosyltransferase family 4 protein [Staphylococcus sp. 10602379]NJI02764.1 capsular biosynthesis protein [Staphylococcus agnetis]NJI12595.1 capsular biosynthesis protein [Staphylococcus agnetis]PTH13725.1 capsular biosynthesis protein [Staphylococcus agnetis]